MPGMCIVRSRGRQIVLSTLIVAGGALLGSSVNVNAHAAATDCDAATVTEALQRATLDTPQVVVNCNLTVPRHAVITKRLVVQGRSGSGVTIDCNGATVDGLRVPELADDNGRKDMILIKSTGSGDAWNPSWSRPAGVTVKRCNVIGSVRIRGMTTREDTRDMQESSYRSGYVRQLRLIAPTRVTFDDLTVTAWKRSPVYFGAGVTYSSLVDSELKGDAASVALYLDAESSRNTIKNNYIHTRSPREIVAVDASSFNRIIDNRFSALNHGGIYLYRNCGERGVVRHTTPSHNTIVNNIFYYKDYNPHPYNVRPAVYMGSRNGSPGYCDEDDDQDVGSGASNRDFAQENVVAQNQLYKLSVDLMIKEGSSTDSPNVIMRNTTVATPTDRLAGCYVANGYFTTFVEHGQSIGVFRRPDGSRYTGPRRTCRDGELVS